MTDPARALLDEAAELTRRLADPDAVGDQAEFRRASRRYAALAPVVACHEEVQALARDLAAARELGAEDASFAQEAVELEHRLAEAQDRLRLLLLPRDPDDDRDVFLEVKAGEGGEESALFAGDLARMYLRYAERVGWRTEIVDASPSDLGGYKDVRIAVSATGTPGPGEAPWARLKFEAGVHRVQRVPVTESQGRIHTSAAGVWVIPQVDDPGEVDIDPNDLRIDVFRSSGPGGQSVNTTDSAVRITHLPTGTVVSCQNEKSQIQNREAAMRVLRARLRQAALEAAAAAEAGVRAGQVRTVDRSERIRTYNFPENRVSDHRTGYKAHNLPAVLDGDLDALLGSAVAADEAARLAALGQE